MKNNCTFNNSTEFLIVHTQYSNMDPKHVWTTVLGPQILDIKKDKGLICLTPQHFIILICAVILTLWKFCDF